MADDLHGRLHAAETMRMAQPLLSTMFPAILDACRSNGSDTEKALTRADKLHKLLRRAIRDDLAGNKRTLIQELESLECQDRG